MCRNWDDKYSPEVNDLLKANLRLPICSPEVTDLLNAQIENTSVIGEVLRLMIHWMCKMKPEMLQAEQNNGLIIHFAQILGPQFFSYDKTKGLWFIGCSHDMSRCYWFIEFINWDYNSSPVTSRQVTDSLDA